MLDIKILAAVLTSLTAFAAVTSGGAVSRDKATNLQPDKLKKLFEGSNPIKKFKKILKPEKEPETHVKASLKVQNLSHADIYGKSIKVLVSGMRNLSYGDGYIESNRDIRLESFTGSISPGKEVRIKGTISELRSSGVNISGTLKVDQKVESNRITVKDIPDASFSFPSATGTIKSNSTSTIFRENHRKVTIERFRGNMTIYVSNKTVRLEGKIYKLSSGSLEIGG